MKELKEFICSHGGKLDIQQATLSVELGLTTEVDQFRKLLKGSEDVFSVSIKLNWVAKRCYEEQHIANAGTEVLHLGGITAETLPEHYFDCPVNRFAKIMRHTKLRFLKLFDYPRPQEHWIHVGQFSLRTRLLPAESSRSRMELRFALEKFGEQVARAQELSEWEVASKELYASFENHGFSDVKVFNFHNDNWEGTFDLEEGVFLEVHLSHLEYPVAHLASGTLQKLTVDLFDVMFDQSLHLFAREYKGLHGLNISTSEGFIPFYSESVVKMCLPYTRPLRLTLFERVHDGRGRIVALLDVSGRGVELSGDGALDFQQQITDATESLKFLQ